MREQRHFAEMDVMQFQASRVACVWWNCNALHKFIKYSNMLLQCRTVDLVQQ